MSEDRDDGKEEGEGWAINYGSAKMLIRTLIVLAAFAATACSTAPVSQRQVQAVAVTVRLVTDPVDARAVTCEFTLNGSIVSTPVKGGICDLDISNIAVGNHTAVVIIKDAAGNPSGPSNNLAFTRPANPPVMPAPTLIK